MGTIYLVPFGNGDWSVLDAVAEAVEQTFNRPCRQLPPQPIPRHIRPGRRGQYLAERFLEILRELPLPDAERRLGVVDLDLYAPGLNFVFGQASVWGGEAVIALPRLRQSFYGLPDDPTLFTERAIKEAIHELGHTYGLGHCPAERCVMHFSNRLADTDFKHATFCVRCREELAKALAG
jgi:archaemetzincin